MAMGGCLGASEFASVSFEDETSGKAGNSLVLFGTFGD